VKNFTSPGGRVNINMTLNSLNYKTVMDVIREWDEIAERISIQFHTPFIDDDPLWLPFGEERNKLIDDLLEYSSKENDHFVINPKEQLELLRGNWGYKCPNWMILVLDYKGNIKAPCCMGSETRMLHNPNATNAGSRRTPDFLRDCFQTKKYSESPLNWHVNALCLAIRSFLVTKE
jgi:hypothetical protein